MLERILDTIESCNLNFLVGSGLSSPYLKTLGLIETLLTDLEKTELPDGKKKLIRCSLYKTYFDGVISRNCKILKEDPEAKPVLNAYLEFVKAISTILLKRKSTIVGKEANLFTTNIDIFLEQTIERIGLECNDGFSGRFTPWFALSNFKKAHFKRSLQYDNVSELPTLNLLKLHGSLTWRIAGDGRILFSPDLRHVEMILTKNVTQALLLDIGENSTIEGLASGCDGKRADATVDGFLEAYDNLPIVNPTKAKFKHTILNQTHYELLRIYSNELEKENTLLLATGFSFADEHIREITLRAANSNPTLIIYIIAYDSNSAAEIGSRFPALNMKNDNIVIVGPDVDKNGQDSFKYDLPTINKKVLGHVLERIGIDNPRSTSSPGTALSL
jgi:hypothetical protein